MAGKEEEGAKKMGVRRMKSAEYKIPKAPKKKTDQEKKKPSTLLGTSLIAERATVTRIY